MDWQCVAKKKKQYWYNPLNSKAALRYVGVKGLKKKKTLWAEKCKVGIHVKLTEPSLSRGEGL